MTNREIELPEKTDFFIKDGKLLCCMLPDQYEKIEIPAGVEEIAGYAFINYDKMIHLVIPETVRSIEKNAVYFDEWEPYENVFVLLEIQGQDVRMQNPPCNLLGNEGFKDESLYTIVAPDKSQAMDFATEHEIPCSTDMEHAVEEFLKRITDNFIDVRDEAGDGADVSYYFDKVEKLARYAIDQNIGRTATIFRFCQIAFNVSSNIRGMLFQQKEAVSYLTKYHLAEEYIDQT